jgi:hypothetical protein
MFAKQEFSFVGQHEQVTLTALNQTRGNPRHFLKILFLLGLFLPALLTYQPVRADSAPMDELNAGLNDAWFNPATSGQGFFVIVFPDIKQVFMGWFAYDTERPAGDATAMLGEPGHRWLTAQGNYDGNRAELTVTMTKGGIFDSGVPAPVSTADGTIVVEFAGCEAGTVSYDIPSIDSQGIVPIQRVVADNIALCEELAELIAQ